MPRALLSIATLSLALAGQSLAAGAAPPEAQLKRGKLLFTQCQACHQVKPGAPSLLGPNLAGIMGRKAAVEPGFRYSPALEKSNLTWNAATLFLWLARPSSWVPVITMAFAGRPMGYFRAAVFAWLAAETAPKKK